MSRAKAGNHNLCCLRYCNASSPFSVRNACRQAPCCPFLLNRFEVIAQILDALAHRGFIVIFEILEEGPPHRHLGGTVSRKAGSESQDIGDIFFGKGSAVSPGEYCEVGWMSLYGIPEIIILRSPKEARPLPVRHTSGF